MKKKILSIILLSAFCLVLFSACSPSGYPIDIGGVTIKDAPQKVVVLSDSAATVITALGYDSYIVAAPETFKSIYNGEIETAGTSTEPDIEKIISLSPDLVISAESFSQDYNDALELHNIKCAVLPAPEVYENLKKYYTDIASIFLGDKKNIEAADAYITAMEASIAELKTTNSAKTNKALLYVEDGYVATGDTLAGQVLNMAGINNIAADKTSYMMSAAEIIKSNPDVIFCPKGYSQTIISNSIFKDVSAVKNGAVHEINVSEIVYAGANLCVTLNDMSNYLK